VIIVPVEPRRQRMPIPADQVEYLIAIAARAPSVHNTQPWRFRVTAGALELYADPARRLRRSAGQGDGEAARPGRRMAF